MYFVKVVGYFNFGHLYFFMLLFFMLLCLEAIFVTLRFLLLPSRYLPFPALIYVIFSVDALALLRCCGHAVLLLYIFCFFVQFQRLSVGIVEEDEFLSGQFIDTDGFGLDSFRP